MLVMDKDGNLFDERRKADRRFCKRRDNDLINVKKAKTDDRRKDDRRKDDINKK